jgi:uncharacterized protein (TIGR01777 family)
MGKLIVTGGTGFVGRPLCQALESAGHELVVLTRSPRPSTSPRIRFVGWQPPAPDPWEGEIEGAQGLINLAGEPVAARRWTAIQKQRILDSRVETTKALVRAISRASLKPSIFISASAVGYYGPRGDELVTEREPAGGDFLSAACQQWEAAAQAAASAGVRVVCLRIGLVLARDGGALARMLPPFQWGVGGPLGSGRQWVSWIHRDDLIGLIRLALDDSRVSGSVNATAPTPVTMREFARTLGRALRRPALAPVPAFVLRVLLGEMADMLLTGQRVAPEVAQRLGFVFRYPQLPDALSACLRSMRP